MAWPLDIEAKPLVTLVHINFAQMPTLPNYPKREFFSSTSLRTMCPKSRCGECATTMSTIQSKWASPDIPHLNEGGYPLARSIDSN